MIKFQNDHVRRLRPEDSGRSQPSIAYMGYRTEAPEYAVTVLTCGETLIIEPSGRRWGRVDRNLDGSTRTLPSDDEFEFFYPSAEIIIDFAESQGLITSWVGTPLSEKGVDEMGVRALSGEPDPEPEACGELAASPGVASVVSRPLCVSSWLMGATAGSRHDSSSATTTVIYL